MLISNNPNIPSEVVVKKVAQIYRHRRRLFSLFSSSVPQVRYHGDSEDGFHNLITSPKGKFRDYRKIIKAIPLIGAVAINLNRKKREIFAPGLNWKVRIRLLPVIGEVAAWVYSIANLNKIRVNNIRALDELKRTHEITSFDLSEAQNIVRNLNAKINQIDSYISNEKIEIKKLKEEFLNFISENQSRLNDEFGRFTQMTSAQIVALEQQNARFTRQWHLLDIAINFEAETINKTAGVAKENKIKSARTDNFYAEFEDAFRGDCESISRRLKVYLPYFKNLNKSESLPVLDVGCGRGEWMGILTDYGIKTIGIDLNIGMVDKCMRLGFNVKCGDAIKYLQEQPEGSIAAITGFHIIEHLSFEQLLALFDSALQALSPGGFVIFETPNPENILVGSCNFYYDPTHNHPIVPAVAEFIARQRGFASAEILRLHPYPGDHHFNEDSEMAKRLNKLLYGSQDYAILAWKANAN